MKELLDKIRPLARQIAALKGQMKVAGLFTDDRELLDCPRCGLREDVLISGNLITYRKPNYQQDTGMRFWELTDQTFRCPSCGQTVSEPLGRNNKIGGSSYLVRLLAPQPQLGATSQARATP